MTERLVEIDGTLFDLDAVSLVDNVEEVTDLANFGKFYTPEDGQYDLLIIVGGESYKPSFATKDAARDFRTSLVHAWRSYRSQFH